MTNIKELKQLVDIICSKNPEATVECEHNFINFEGVSIKDLTDSEIKNSCLHGQDVNGNLAYNSFADISVEI